jgi:phage-related protein
MSSSPPDKPLFWVGSSLKDVRDFPEDVKDEVGFALYQAQRGLTPRSAKVLRGFGGASVLEIVEDFRTDTYRAVYTVQFAGVVYVLHAFQKKSKRGVETPKAEIEIIKSRLKLAKEHYDEWRQDNEEHNEEEG